MNENKLLEKTFKGKNCLVTGGAGFIGSHLSEKLMELGANVAIYDNMMRGRESYRNITEIFEKYSPVLIVGDILDFDKLKKSIENQDFIFHLAALPSHRLALERPREYALIDLVGTVNVLEAMRLTGSSAKMLFASSNKVYGKQEPPWREDKPVIPEGPYATSKASAEEFCRQYYKYYGIKSVIIRYHHVIGTRTNSELVLAIFTERVLKNLPPEVHGKKNKNGEFESCSADYTNVSDAVRGSLIASSKIDKFDIFNLAKPTLTTIKDMADIVIKHLGKNIKPIYVDMLSHETLVHHSDVSKAKETLGFEAQIPAEVSIKQYVDWRLKYGDRF